MKTAEQFKVQAELKNITSWKVHDCSLCNYPCGYVMPKDGPNSGLVGYDSGCDCVTYGPVIKLSNWDNVAEQYNIQTNDGVIKEMNDFWGFE